MQNHVLSSLPWARKPEVLCSQGGNAVKTRAFFLQEPLLQQAQSISPSRTASGRPLRGLGLNPEGDFWLGYVQ